MDNLIIIILTTVGIATLLNILLKRINIPTVIGYILAGAIIVIIFNLDVHGNDNLEYVAELGIAFLMFTIGLELSVDEVRLMRKELFLFGSLQVLLSAVVIFSICILFIDIEYKTAILVGLGLALSPVPIVLKVLNESGEIKTKYGRSAKGILIFQEVSLVPMLLMITIFTNVDKDLGELLKDTLINGVLTLGILIIIGKFILVPFFKAVSQTNSKEIYMSSVLLIVVGATFIAHHFGFSFSLGALIAGMMISETIYKYQVEADLIPFRDLLLGVFFITVGMQVDVHVIFENIFLIVILVSIIMLIKALVVFGILSFFMTKKDALKVGVSLAQIGGSALVIFSLLLSNEMIEVFYVQIIIVVIVISMILTPIVLSNLEAIVGVFFKKPTIIEGVSSPKVSQEHIILCGYGVFGQRVSQKLDNENIEHQIITNNTEDFIKARQNQKNIFYGEPTDKLLLESLYIKNSLGVIIALDNLEEIEHVCATISQIDSKISIMAKVGHSGDLKKLESFNLKSVLDTNDEISTVFVEDIIKSRLLIQETRDLQYLNDYDFKSPKQAIKALILEQARLLDIISEYFSELREGKDILLIKVYHDSFVTLSEIINELINDLTLNANLSAQEYNQINTLLVNQNKYEQLNLSMGKLGKDLFNLSKFDESKGFCNSVVEGLDTILFSLKDVATQKDDTMLLEIMTSSDSKGLEKIRLAYLGGNNNLNQETKKILLSATNLTEQIILNFGTIGQNYNKLFLDQSKD